MLKGKKILLGVTGSIAAYKAALLVRILVKEGAEVKVIMTAAAKDFISPLTLGTLTKNPVITDLFKDDAWANHVMLGRWADLILIAPLSCNTLARMAAGICDNLLLSVYLSAACPVMVAPAMDEDMWKHPATRRNLRTLATFGHHVVQVGTGELASGLYGEGRMAEPDDILKEIVGHFHQQGSLKGKKAMVTAGPTFEHIDPVRFIGNHSSGKMGVAIARELLNRGAEVTLILGPATGELQLEGLDTIRVQTAREMYDACHRAFGETDITVMAAAVADYTPALVAPEKIKKNEEDWSLTLKKTPDILKSLGQMKKDGQTLVGFALETRNERDNALSKLAQKNADIIVLNSLTDQGAGFGKDTNKITVFDRNGGERRYELKSKTEVAKDIVDYIMEYTHA